MLLLYHIFVILVLMFLSTRIKRPTKTHKNVKSQKPIRPSKTAVKSILYWFENSVLFEGKPFVLDAEQAAAVLDNHHNTLVSARAGSGKTRTIVAKLAYLIAHEHISPSEILVFVFNHNAADEINTRLSSILVDGQPLGHNFHIATTFHAFARDIVYNYCDESGKYGDILADNKTAFLTILLQDLPAKTIYDFYHLNPEFTPPQEYSNMRNAFISLIDQFINRAEQNFLDDLPGLKSKIYSINSPHTKLFLKISLHYYQKYLLALSNPPDRPRGFQNYGIDFNLLIHVATKHILSQLSSSLSDKLAKIKYLLVDEYQDFSKLFLQMINAIRESAPSSHLFVVGDDWQAINRFAGSNVDYFLHFSDYFTEDSCHYEITTNYRCDRDIVDGARKFIAKSMRERGNFKPFSRNLGSAHLVISTTLSDYLSRISDIIFKHHDSGTIMILHRNNEINFCCLSLEDFNKQLSRFVISHNILSPEEYESKIRIMTMHRSKGLEADVVIILEANDGVTPSSRSDSDLFEIFGETPAISLDDQKRLFYVAITRAKHNLYILHAKPKPSTPGFLPYLPPSLFPTDEP